jgi:hypothetical protein
MKRFINLLFCVLVCATTFAQDAKTDFGQNTSERYQKLLKAAEQGDADAQVELGNCYYEGQGVKQDDGEGVAWIRKAAEQGLAEAQYTLGGFYEYGQGVEKDIDKAAEWYKKAADQGDDIAKVRLSILGR